MTVTPHGATPQRSDDDPSESVTVLTGAGGWFGRAYLQRRADDGASGPLRAVVGSPLEVPDVLGLAPEAQVHVGDLADAAFVARVFEGSRGAAVVHAGGVIHPRTVADFARVNVDGTANVLAAARAVGAGRLVHLSSNSPFGANARPDDAFRQHEPYRPYQGYGRSKMAAEQLVLAAADRGDLDTVVVRPPWFYGPWQPDRQTSFFTLIRRGRFPVLGDGSQRRSMVHVGTLVEGVLLAQRVPEATGQAFWVADARPYPMHEIVATVREALRAEGYDVSNRAVRLPALLGRTAERVDSLLQGRGIYHQEIHVLGEMDKTIACDVSETVRVLGFRPATSLVDGMREAIRWCRARGLTL